VEKIMMCEKDNSNQAKHHNEGRILQYPIHPAALFTYYYQSLLVFVP